MRHPHNEYPPAHRASPAGVSPVTWLAHIYQIGSGKLKMACLKYRRQKRLPVKLTSSLSCVLLILFFTGSHWQYKQTGEVTWLTTTFQYLEGGMKPSAREAPKTRGRPPAYDFSGRVMKVKDGDSFIVRSDGVEYEVRLYGIDAPEWKQPHGDIARQHLTGLIGSRNVEVEYITIDSYNRSVSVVYLDGLNVNVEMVRTGNAWWYRKYAPDNKALLDAESEAKTNKRGLWKNPQPIPPWDWRKKH